VANPSPPRCSIWTASVHQRTPSGHAAGDEVLRRTAAILTGALCAKSDLMARWGGEEFVALFPQHSMEGAGMARP